MSASPRERRFDLAFLAALFVAVSLAYARSLDLVPMADHLDFLSDTFGHYRTLDIFAHSYSYNRTRVFAPGDTSCFRPALFFALSAIKGLFGSEFAYGQAVGIALHALVTGLLFALLKRLCAPWSAAPEGENVAPIALASLTRSDVFARVFPYVATAFFALNPANSGMVDWVHITPYMMFTALLLGSAHLLVGFVDRPSARLTDDLPRLVAAWTLALLAALTHELGQFFAVLAGVFLAVSLRSTHTPRQRFSLAGVFAGVMAVYQLANRLDLRIHQTTYRTDLTTGAILAAIPRVETLRNVWRLALYVFVQPLFPTKLHARYLMRLFIDEPELRRFTLDLPLVVGGVVLVAATALLVPGVRAVAFREGRARRVAWWIGLVLGAYAGLIVCGRMNMRPYPEVLSCNSYYTYMPLVFGLLIAGPLWCASGEAKGRVWGALRASLLVGMSALTLYGGMAVWRIHRDYAERTGLLSAQVGFINGLVRAHGDEPGFSLAFDPAGFPWMRGLTLMSIYFHEYENNDHPRYVVGSRVTPTGASMVVTSFDEYQQAHPQLRAPLFPTLVKPGSRFHVFRFNGQYFAMLYTDAGARALGRVATAEEAEARAHAWLARRRDTR
jgi:hypothetical protein